MHVLNQPLCHHDNESNSQNPKNLYAKLDLSKISIRTSTINECAVECLQRLMQLGVIA